jgi:hypothetical protein
MTTAIKIRPQDLGHDGRCDHDAGCSRQATVVLLSASAPACSCGRCDRDAEPPACLAFCCDEHATAEPVALREHAEHQAHDRTGTARHVWDQLLATYPEPLRIG